MKNEKWKVKSEKCSQANELGYVVKSEEWLSHINMRAFAFCCRGDLQIALCWHVREWRSEKWKVKSEECSQANELGYVVKSEKWAVLLRTAVYLLIILFEAQENI